MTLKFPPTGYGQLQMAKASLPETPELVALSMPSLKPPTVCAMAIADGCGHQNCQRWIAQAKLPCCYCVQPIEPGARYYVLQRLSGRVTAQAHIHCEESVR